MIYLVQGKDPSADDGLFVIIIPDATSESDAFIKSRQLISIKDREDLVDAVIDAKYTLITEIFSTVEQGDRYTHALRQS